MKRPPPRHKKLEDKAGILVFFVLELSRLSQALIKVIAYISLWAYLAGRIYLPSPWWQGK